MSSAQNKVIERITDNANRLMDSYARSDMLLKDAVKDAMAWVPGLISGSSFPRPQQLEHLCTQLLAIVIVSEPEPRAPKGPTVKYGMDEKRGMVWEQS